MPSLEEYEDYYEVTEFSGKVLYRRLAEVWRAENNFHARVVPTGLEGIFATKLLAKNWVEAVWFKPESSKIWLPVP